MSEAQEEGMADGRILQKWPPQADLCSKEDADADECDNNADEADAK